MSSTPDEVFPSEFGGFGKVKGLPKENKGGLQGISFSPRCPLDLNPSSRIVAVCGITDQLGFAAPNLDGWFLSDFYLFHHLFKRVGANQIWLTSENPEDLVDKYGAYAHGNPFEERREVLSKNLLPEVNEDDNIRVLRREDLCERFVSTLRSEIGLCIQKKQSLLVLIFGHGESDSHSVYIGTKSGKPGKFRISEMVTMARASSDGCVPKISLLMTSCYSGGWAISPSLNISAMTAVGPNAMSLSWCKSKSVGRACGSIYATAVLQALLKVEGETQNEFEFDSPTYAELSRVIHTTLCSDVDRLGESHEIMFAAQDDDWEMEWKSRSGIPLIHFKERWELLAQIPPQENDLTNRNPAGVQNLDEPQLGLRGGMVSRKKVFHLKATVRCLACKYFASNPGDASTSGNHFLDTKLNMVLNHHDFGYDELDLLRTMVEYRLSVMRLATACKDMLGLSFPDCADFSWDEWQREIALDKANGNDGLKMKAKDRSRRCDEVFCLINAARIFPSADYETQGLDYAIPIKYLAVAISESSTPDRFASYVLKLEQAKNKLIQSLAVKDQRFNPGHKRERSLPPQEGNSNRHNC